MTSPDARPRGAGRRGRGWAGRPLIGKNPSHRGRPPRHPAALEAESVSPLRPERLPSGVRSPESGPNEPRHLPAVPGRTGGPPVRVTRRSHAARVGLPDRMIHGAVPLIPHSPITPLLLHQTPASPPPGSPRQRLSRPATSHGDAARAARRGPLGMVWTRASQPCGTSSSRRRHDHPRVAVRFVGCGRVMLGQTPPTAEADRTRVHKVPPP